MKRAVYPGSFDPVTYGHLDLIERGARLFDHLTVAVLLNPEKTFCFSVAQRVKMLEEACDHLKNVQVVSFSGLLADFVRIRGFDAVLRGVRNGWDLEREMRMATVNGVLCQGLETVFLPAANHLTHLSSSLVKEIAIFHGDVRGLVPEEVAKALYERFHH